MNVSTAPLLPPQDGKRGTRVTSSAASSAANPMDEFKASTPQTPQRDLALRLMQAVPSLTPALMSLARQAQNNAWRVAGVNGFALQALDLTDNLEEKQVLSSAILQHLAEQPETRLAAELVEKCVPAARSKDYVEWWLEDRVTAATAALKCGPLRTGADIAQFGAQLTDPYWGQERDKNGLNPYWLSHHEMSTGKAFLNELTQHEDTRVAAEFTQRATQHIGSNSLVPAWCERELMPRATARGGAELAALGSRILSCTSTSAEASDYRPAAESMFAALRSDAEVGAAIALADDVIRELEPQDRQFKIPEHSALHVLRAAFKYPTACSGSTLAAAGLDAMDGVTEHVPEAAVSLASMYLRHLRPMFQKTAGRDVIDTALGALQGCPRGFNHVDAANQFRATARQAFVTLQSTEDEVARFKTFVRKVDEQPAAGEAISRDGDWVVIGKVRVRARGTQFYMIRVRRSAAEH